MTGLDTLIHLDKELLLVLNGSASLYLDGVVKTLTTASTWIPLYLSLFYLVVKNNDSVQKIVLILGCAGLCVLLCDAVCTNIVKPGVGRWRPTHDAEIGALVDIVNGYRGGRFGFFSGHASNTFSIAVFFCWLVRSRLLSFGLITWSLVNCWTRLYLGVHFPGDILVGLLYGAAVGSLVYYLYVRISRCLLTKSNFISSFYTSTGYQKDDIDIVILVLVLTFLYALLRACFYLYVY